LIRICVVRPILETVETLKDIAQVEGDLTRRLQSDRADELGELAKWFNKFVGRIEGVVRQIAGGASTLGDASQAVRDNAAGLSLGAEKSKSQSAMVSAAAEEMSINLTNVAQSTNEMSEKVSKISSAINEMETSIERVAAIASQSAMVAEQATVIVQTNTGRIDAMGIAAKTMQASTSDAVGSMQEISQVITRVNTLSREIAQAVDNQKQTTRQIASDISTTVAAAESVAYGINETALASREITQSIARVDQNLAKTTAGANDSQTAGEELSRLASQMQTMVSQFRVADSAGGNNPILAT